MILCRRVRALFQCSVVTSGRAHDGLFTVPYLQAHASVDAFVGLSPLLLLAADEDVSLDDSVRCAKIAKQAVSVLTIPCVI